MKFRKSQIAIETLAVYGFAILMVAISIGALYYFSFTQEKHTQQFCQLQNGLLCADFVVEESQIKVTVSNTKGVGIEITDYAASDCSSTSTSIIVPADGKTTLTFGPCSIANYYDGDINITYSNSDSELVHIVKGEVRGTIGR